MFKKNPNRPTINISLKKTSQGYRILPNQAYQLFTTKKIVRSIYRPDLIQMSNQHIQGVGNAGTMASGTMIQPPSHATLPAVANWFKEDEIHKIERQYFPQYFRQDVKTNVFSFSIKNSNLYTYYRNSMISLWRENSKKYLSPSLCRKNLLGDVSSIMRIHAFLENWGLINFPSKEHNKGIVISKPQSLVCFVCQRKDSKSYYIAQIQDIQFQICEGCFQQNCYPQSIKKAEFKKILFETNANNQKQMDKNQIIRMLQIINGIPNGAPRDKDRDTWSVIQKQFPDISKQKILKAFLKIPLNVDMHGHIFQNNQDDLAYQTLQQKKQIQLISQPSVFEDFQNPILGSVAHMIYSLQKNKQDQHKQTIQQKETETLKIDEPQKQQQTQKSVNLYKKIIEAAQEHCSSLCKDQQQKIKNLTKMLIQVVISRLELKSLFVNEFQRLVRQEQRMNSSIINNQISQLLKQKMRLYSVGDLEPTTVNGTVKQKMSKKEDQYFQQLNNDQQNYKEQQRQQQINGIEHHVQ